MNTKFLIVCGLIVMSSALAQNTSMPAKECLSKCDQSKASWVTCAAECVGVPHPTNKDVQDTKDCFNLCDKNDGGCQNNCIKTHFISGHSDGAQSHPSSGSGSATPSGIMGPATNIPSRTGSVMTTGASNIATSTEANRSTSVVPASGSTRNDATIVVVVSTLLSGLIWGQL